MLEENAALVSLFPQTESREELPFGEDAYDDVKKVIEVFDGEGATLGYAINLKVNGYNGVINMTVGLYPDGMISGLRIVSNTETAGLGSKVAEPEFYGQFGGVETPVVLGESVDAVSGATISSTAVVKGVNLAAQVMDSMQ